MGLRHHARRGGDARPPVPWSRRRRPGTGGELPMRDGQTSSRGAGETPETPTEPRPAQAAAPQGPLTHIGRLAVPWRLGAGLVRPGVCRLLAPAGLQRHRRVCIVCWYFVFLLVYGTVVAIANPRHIVTERLVAATLYLIAALVIFGLATTVIYTFARGLAGIRHLNFFTHDMAGVSTTAPLNQGGILHAIVGTVIMVGIAVVVAVPLGIGTAVYMTEVKGPGSHLIRTVVEAMTALSDILAGLFVYALLVVGFGLGKTGLAAAIAIAMTMLPLVARASEVALRVVPGSLRQASEALGATHWKTTWKVVLPSARAGLVTAAILAIARGIGETAVVLVTTGASSFFNSNPVSEPMNSLPLYIYTAYQTHRAAGADPGIRGGQRAAWPWSSSSSSSPGGSCGTRRTDRSRLPRIVSMFACSDPVPCRRLRRGGSAVRRFVTAAVVVVAPWLLTPLLGGSPQAGAASPLSRSTGRVRAGRPTPSISGYKTSTPRGSRSPSTPTVTPRVVRTSPTRSRTSRSPPMASRLRFDDRISDTSNGRAYAYLPVAAGGTSFPYQIKFDGTQVENLRLSGETLAKIFTNQITNWDDPEITKDNNGIALPSIPIVPVVQSEGSGATQQLTNYFSTEYPSIWDTFAGQSGPTEYFPRQGDQIAQNGSTGAMNYIASSAANGSIGYVEYSYPLSVGYPVAKVLNSGGYYTLPTQYNVAIALEQAQINMDPTSPNYLLQTLTNVYTDPDPRTYPLSSYVYMIEPTGGPDRRDE